MLTRIFVDNFRAFVNFEFRPERMTLLLGDNETGKTSLFDALAILTDIIVRGARAGELLWGTRTIWDKRNVQRFELDAQSPAGLYRYVLEVSHPADRTELPSIRAESVTLDGTSLHRFSDGQVQIVRDDGQTGPQFPFGSEQSFLGNLGPAGSKLGWFKQFMAGVSARGPRTRRSSRRRCRGASAAVPRARCRMMSHPVDLWRRSALLTET